MTCACGSNQLNMPNASVPMVNSDGSISQAWYHWFLNTYTRTGAGGTTSQFTISDQITQAQTTATNAQNAANGAQNTANAAQTSANTANAAVAAETTRAEAAEAALAAQLDSVTFIGTGATATAGGGAAVPATVTAFLDITIGATAYRIPLFNP
jgi:hypothetical protein